MLLSWQTGSEVDTAGFSIVRSSSKEGAYEKITSKIIPSTGSASAGASYVYTDTSVQPGATYYYKLEDIDSAGAVTLHGPVKAEMSAGASITLLSPVSGSPFPSEPPVFTWEAEGATKFRVQFSKDSSFRKKMTLSIATDDKEYTPTAKEWKKVARFMGTSDTLYWRISAKTVKSKTAGSKTMASDALSLSR